LRGGVVDWIKPTLSSGSLNVADLSINAAVIALLVALALDWRRHRRGRAGGGPQPPGHEPLGPGPELPGPQSSG
jgi:hypothetical protein